MSPHIPTEIITNILSRLPVKSISRFRCVSKPWCSLIKDPSFIKLHLDHHHHRAVPNVMVRYSTSDLFSVKPNLDSNFHEAKFIEYPYRTPPFPLEILGSCNGLLFIRPDKDVYCIWNPTTHEYKKLPPAPIEAVAEDEDEFEFEFEFEYEAEDEAQAQARIYKTVGSINYGFGYDDSADDYKVVRIVCFQNGKSEVKVYSLGSDSWTRVEDVPPCHIHYEWVPGVLVNGRLHWVATLNQTSKIKMIISFDLSDHKFKLVPLTDYEQNSFYMNVGVFRGCLCLLNYFHAPVRVELRVMMDYGVKESWTTLYSFYDTPTIKSFQYFNPSCQFLLEDKEIVWRYLDSVHTSPLRRKYSAPNIPVNSISSLFKLVPAGGPLKWSESETYVESLVSLNTATYVLQKQPKRRRTNNMRQEES